MPTNSNPSQPTVNPASRARSVAVSDDGLLSCPRCGSNDLVGAQEVLYVQCDIWLDERGRITIDGGEPEFELAETVGVDCRVCGGAWDAHGFTELSGLRFV